MFLRNTAYETASGIVIALKQAFAVLLSNGTIALPIHWTYSDPANRKISIRSRRVSSAKERLLPRKVMTITIIASNSQSCTYNGNRRKQFIFPQQMECLLVSLSLSFQYKVETYFLLIS